MPANNTSLDRFYKTTAHWDQWKQYRELINDEYQNGAKSQVIKREFNGVKQYQEEKKRLTEGDRLLNLDVDKSIERFKKSITEAKVELGRAKTEPLNDLFFHYNSLVVSYNTLTSVSSGQQISQSTINKFMASLQTAVPPLIDLQNLLLKIAVMKTIPSDAVTTSDLDKLMKVIQDISVGKGKKYGGVDPPAPEAPPAPAPIPAPTPAPAPAPAPPV